MDPKILFAPNLKATVAAVSSQGRLVLFNPVGCWETIRSDSRSIAEIYKGYLGPIAAVAAICGFIGSRFSGSVPFLASFLSYLASFSLGLAMIFFVAGLVSKIAPRFQGASNLDSAFRWLAFSSTATYLGGFFLIVPKAAPLSLLLAVYGAAIAWCGITPMLNVGKEQRLIFALTTTLAVAAFFGVGILLLWAFGAR